MRKLMYFASIQNEDVQSLAKEQEHFVAIIDDILVAHYELIEYLKSIILTTPEDAV